MKKYIWLFGLTILVLAAVNFGSQAYADDTNGTQTQAVPSVHQIEAQFEYQLSTRQEPYGQPKATSNYDDLEDHYEQVQLVRDDIDRGIPSGSWWAPSSS